MNQLNGTLTGTGSLVGMLAGADTISGSMSVPRAREINPFEGAYEYTPSDEAQTIAINGLRATQNIIINAIPNNYGLITWNGSTLTVS